MSDFSEIENPDLHFIPSWPICGGSSAPLCCIMPNRPVRPLKNVTPVGTRRNADTFMERISPPSSVQVTVEPVWYLAVSSAFDRAVSSLSPTSMFSPKAVGWRQLKALSEPSRPGGGSRISFNHRLLLTVLLRYQSFRGQLADYFRKLRKQSIEYLDAIRQGRFPTFLRGEGMAGKEDLVRETRESSPFVVLKAIDEQRPNRETYNRSVGGPSFAV
jgi:hypothetical protein